MITPQKKGIEFTFLFICLEMVTCKGRMQHLSSSITSCVCSAKKQWLVQRMENRQQATKQQQLGILRGLVDADAFESFLASKFPASKVSLPAFWPTVLPRNKMYHIYAAHYQHKTSLTFIVYWMI